MSVRLLLRCTLQEQSKEPTAQPCLHQLLRRSFVRCVFRILVSSSDMRQATPRDDAPIVQRAGIGGNTSGLSRHQNLGLEGASQIWITVLALFLHHA